MSVKVLLADSSVSNHKVVELAISERDVDLSAVTDGNAALEMVQEIKPDIVLADIELPRMDGYALCEAIKSDPELAHAKVFLLKTSFATYNQERANKAGAAGMLEKPFSPSALLNVIDTGIQDFAGKTTSTVEPGDMEKSEEGPMILDVSDEASFGDLELGDQAAAGEFAGAPPEAPPVEEPSEALDLSDTVDRMEDLALEEAPVIAEVEEVPPAELAPPELTEIETPVEAIGRRPPEIEDAIPLAVDEELAETPLEISLEGAEEAVAVPALEEEAVGPEPEPAAPIRGDLDPVVERVTRQVVERLGLAGIHAVDEDTAEKLGRDLVEEIVRKLSDDVVREVAWEVVPDLAERMIRDAIEEITKT
ncbi:MAG TPA: response regulator [Acidobacteriota bacterium]|nr:response regulator [Acidobacteriota bacterium]